MWKHRWHVLTSVPINRNIFFYILMYDSNSTWVICSNGSYCYLTGSTVLFKLKWGNKHYLLKITLTQQIINFRLHCGVKQNLVKIESVQSAVFVVIGKQQQTPVTGKHSVTVLWSKRLSEGLELPVSHGAVGSTKMCRGTVLRESNLVYNLETVMRAQSC